MKVRLKKQVYEPEQAHFVSSGLVSDAISVIGPFEIPWKELLEELDLGEPLDVDSYYYLDRNQWLRIALGLKVFQDHKREQALQDHIGNKIWKIVLRPQESTTCHDVFIIGLPKETHT